MIADENTTRGKIERAALQLFAAEGADGVSVKRIARAAGVSQGALYTHYPSKADLAWTLFSLNYLRIGREIRQRVRRYRDIKGKVTAMVKHIFTRFEEDLDLWHYVFFARHAYLERVSTDMGNTYVVMQAVIADAIKKGQLPKQDIELATTMFSGVIVAVADNRIMGRLDKPLTEVVDDVAAGCLRILRYGE